MRCTNTSKEIRRGEPLYWAVYFELYHARQRGLQTMDAVKNKFIGALNNEKGIGTLELIFITVIVLGMAVLFRNQISDIFKKIYEALQKLNNNLNTDPLSQQNT